MESRGENYSDRLGTLRNPPSVCCVKGQGLRPTLLTLSSTQGVVPLTSRSPSSTPRGPLSPNPRDPPEVGTGSWEIEETSHPQESSLIDLRNRSDSPSTEYTGSGCYPGNWVSPKQSRSLLVLGVAGTED